MSKFNKNSLVFGFAIVFIIFGYCGSTIFDLSVFYSEKISEQKFDGIKGQSIAVWNAMHESSDDRLFYFGNLVDINSIKENLLGTRSVEKEYP